MTLKKILIYECYFHFECLLFVFRNVNSAELEQVVHEFEDFVAVRDVTVINTKPASFCVSFV